MQRLPPILSLPISATKMIHGFDSILCCMYHASDLVKSMNRTFIFFLRVATTCFNSNASDPNALRQVTTFVGKHRQLITKESCDELLPKTVDFCHIPTSPINIAYTAFLVLMMIFIFGTNAFFCLSLYNSRQLLRLPSHRFILSLTVSDLLFAVVIIPTMIDYNLHNQRFCSGLTLCHIAFSVDHLVLLSSILILLVIAIDRYVATLYPLRYESLMTQKRANYALWITWGASSLFGIAANIDWKTTAFKGVEMTESKACLTRNPKFTAFIILACLFVPLMVMGFVYYKILRITLKHTVPATILGVLEDEEGLEATTPPSECTSAPERPRFGRLISNISQRKESFLSCFLSPKFKAIRATLMIYGTFAVCWLPGHMITFINLLWPQTILLEVWQYHILNEILPLTNAAMNVFIYTLMNEDCKRAMQKTLCCKVVQRRIQKKRLDEERERRALEKSTALPSSSTVV